jgi:hypothetical protein
MNFGSIVKHKLIYAYMNDTMLTQKKILRKCSRRRNTRDKIYNFMIEDQDKEITPTCMDIFRSYGQYEERQTMSENDLYKHIDYNDISKSKFYSDSCINKVKKVVFNTTTQVILIPTIKEYSDAGLSDKLWTTHDEIIEKQKEYAIELFRWINYNGELSTRENTKNHIYELLLQ